MILDNTLVLSDSQAITADAGSTNVIDLGAPGTPVGASAALAVDIGKGDNISIICNVVEAFNNLTSLTISLQVDDNAAFSSAAEVASKTYLLASINSTKMLSFPATLPTGTNERYLRLYYDVTGTAPSTGKITAAIVAARQSSMVR